jgi:hypothetical protein
MLGALLITDIHFIRPRTPVYDIDVELRNGVLRYVPTLLKALPDISLILVGGDVAYEARDNQYAAAAAFLRDLQARLGGARILVIPGNHDVDRDLTDTPDHRGWRSAPRKSGLDDDQRDRVFIDLLANGQSGPGLVAALRAYNQFASAYGCTVSEAEPFWHVRLPLSDRYELHLRGLTSVLISDRHDDKEVNRLLLGDVQVADLEPAPGVVNVTLCHHPYTWLYDGERQRRRLRRRSALHVTGHEHCHDVLPDGDTASVHLCAGALQPKRSDVWDPRLYGIKLDVSERRGKASARFTIMSARWDRDADSFVEDSTGEYEVPVQPAPAVPPSPPIAADPTAAVALLVEHLSELAPADRLTVAAEIGGDVSSLSAAPEHELPARVVADASARGVLAELWRQAARYRGGLGAEENPFA